MLRHGWKLGFAVLALALLTARAATDQAPFQLHQRALQAIASDGPTNVPCGPLQPDTAGGTITTWSAAHSPYILPLNTTNDPNQPSSACPAFPLPGQAQPTPLPGVLVNPGSTLVIDASQGPVQIFSHGAGITVDGGTLKTVGTGIQNGSLNSVTFDAEPDVASWDGIQILASDAAHRGNASFGYTAIGHALTSITITSGATSTADPSGNTATVPFGLALYNSAIGPSYFDGIDVTDTPISFIGEQAATNGSAPQAQLADGKFGTVNNIGSQGINLSYDGAAPANSAGVDIEGTAFGSSVPFGDTTCPPLSACAAGTIGNSAIQANFAQSPVVPIKVIDNRFYRAGSYGIYLTNSNGAQITNNLFDCNGSGTPKPLVTPCTGNGLKFSAIYLNNATVDLENKVTGDTGQEDGLDAVVFSGTVTSPTFTWKNATNDLNNQHQLGYLISGGMSMNGGTFTVPRGSLVKVKDGGITLTNTKLDASDGGSKLFTSLRDNTNFATFTNITSCPSVFVQSCPNPLPAGEWSGIDIVGSQAAANLNNVSVLYPTTGVMAQGAQGVTITQSTVGTSNIGPTFADGITAVNTPVSVSNTTFGCPAGVCAGDAIGHQGINADYATAGATLPAALTVTGDTFQSSVNEAIIGTGLSGQPVAIANNTISNAGSFGINLQGADHLTLQNNSITNSGVAAPTHSAIYLNGVSNADFNGLISGNTGTGDGLNAIVFHGNTSTPLAWQTVGLPSATSANTLGYMLDGDLIVNGGLTLNTTDPNGDYVPVSNNGKITVKGGPARGTNATFTSFKEHTRLPTCGSVFVPKVSSACQAPAAGDWGGLILASDQANSLTGGEIRYATTGISIGNPGVQQNFDNLTLTNTNVRNTVSDGVHGLSPITIKGGSFSGNGGSAINVDLTAGGVVTGRTIDVENASISGTGSDGIVGNGLATQPIIIKAVGVDHSGGYGIDLVGANQLTLQNNVVTNTASGYAAIYLNGYDGDFSTNVTGNKGAGNGLDALVFHGTVRGSLTWQTARKTNDASRPLGYLLDNTLSMPTAGTNLTVNAGDVVKVGNGGTLQLQDVSLRADNTSSSAQKVFTSLSDNTAGVAACPSQLLPGCLAPGLGDWGGINLSGSGSNGTLLNSAVRYAETGISISNSTTHSPTSSSFGLVVSRSSITSSHADAIDALNTSISVTDSTITGAVHGINANVIGSGATAYLRLSGNRFMSTGAEAILGQALSGQPVWITDNHVQNAATFGIRLVGANALVLRNNNVSCSGVGNETCTLGTAPPYPAIYLDGVSADFANNVRGNVGSNNGMDALAFHGDVNSDLNWLTPTVNTGTQRLGYLLTGALRVNDGTLKVHAGDVVKSLGGPITIRGGVLDASDPAAGAKLFTSLKDTSAYGVTCPSVFTGLCTSAQPGDWGGLVVTNDGLGKPGSANITTGKITDAVTGVAIDSGPTAQFGSSGFGLVIKGTTITDATGDGINAQDTALQVAPLGVTTATPPTATGPTDLERLGAHGIIATFLGGPACAGSCSQSLDVEWATIKSASRDGIVASGLGGQTTIVSNNTIDGSGTYGIRLTGADSLTLQNNIVNNSGGTYPAIFLNHVTGEFSQAISGNNGSGNGLNAIVFDGVANTASTHPFTFLMPQTSGAFGYMLDGQLTVNGDFQSGAGVAKVLTGGIKINGKFTSTNTTFTSMKDSSVGMSACPTVFVSTPCPTSPSTSDYWSGINVDPIGITSSFTGGGIHYAASGLVVSSGELDVKQAILTNNSGYALDVKGSGNAVISCSGIHNNGGGLNSEATSAAPNSTTVSDSDLFGNGAGQDLTASTATTATRVWFGTATPVLSSNVTQVDGPLPQKEPTLQTAWSRYGLTSTNTNVNTDPANDPAGVPVFGNGTLTATLTFDRAMNPNASTPLSVTFAGPGEQAMAHSIGLLDGHWSNNNLTWTGSATIDGNVVDLNHNAQGANAASVVNGTSCVPDAPVPQMTTAESRNFKLDFGTALVLAAPASTSGDACLAQVAPPVVISSADNCGASSATLHGQVNPNGWSKGVQPPNPLTDTYAFFQWRDDNTPTYSANSVADIKALIAGTADLTTLPGYKDVGNGTNPVAVSFRLPAGSLANPDHLYDYRVVAVDLNGIYPGPELTFKTTGAPATLQMSDPPAGNTVDEKVTVFDGDSPAQVVADFTGAVQVTSTDPLATWKLKGSSDSPATFPAALAFSASDLGSKTMTVAFGTAGTQTLTATSGTLNPGAQSETITPNAPSGITITAPSTSELDLSWTAVPGATGYDVKRSATTGGPYTLLGTSPTTATNSYHDTGLAAGTTYYYVLIADSTAGPSPASSEVSGTTIADAPTGLSATASGTTGINLSWTAPTGATSYIVKRSSTTGGPYTQVATPPASPFADSGLSAGTTYYYVVDAVDAGGTSANSTEAQATTVAAAPTGLTATATAHAIQVDLTWTGSTGATSYHVLRGTTTGGPYTSVGTPSSSPFSDTTVAANTTYFYVVQAVDSGGSSANSNEATVTTVPAAPTGITVTAPSTSELDLSWTAVPGATGYDVKRSATTGGPYTLLGTSPTTPTNSYHDTGLTAGTTYYYVLIADSTAGPSPASSEANGTTRANAPSGVTATATGTSGISLNWTAPTGATSYIVKRSSTTGGPYTQVGTPTAASFADTGLSAGTTYYYVVEAVNAGGTSADSSEAQATTVAAAPSTPTATAKGNALEVDLSWPAVTGATGYDVLRGTSPGTETLLGTAPTTATNSFNDTTVAANTTYYYEVEAVDSGGTSAASGDATVTTVPAAPSGITITAPSTSELDLSWTAVPGATGYDVERSATSGNGYTLLGTSPTTTMASYHDTTGLSGGTTYYYIVVADSTAGPSPASSEANGTTLAVAPTGLSATASGTGEINLSWTGSTGATGYNVLRSTTSGSGYTLVGSSPTTTTASYHDTTGLSAGTTYYYVVDAVDAGGTSAHSNEAPATTVPAAPSTPTATAKANALEVDLSWPAVTGATGYNVLRGASPGSETLLGAAPTTATNSFKDTSVAGNTTYYYEVEAVDSGGTSAASGEATVTTVPAAPTGVTATASATPGEIDLSWSAVTGATGYDVLRSTTSGSGYVLVTVSPPTTTGTTYSDTTLVSGTTYYYVVEARSAAGPSPASGEVNAKAN